MQTGNLGNLGFTFKGSWIPTPFSKNDVVTHDNAIYVAVRSALPSEIPKASNAWAFMMEGFTSPYTLCEFYYFRHPTLKPGFMPAHGGLLENAATLYPEAWAYLQTTEGQKLCTTEAYWQAMTRAIWHTNADGSQVGWNGIGGAPFFAPNWETGALRLPDLRGMYAEAAGFDSLGVGGVHGDAIRNMWGSFGMVRVKINNDYRAMGAFGIHHGEQTSDAGGGETTAILFDFNPGRVVPVAGKNQPRAYGVLACVYLGIPR